MAEMKTEQKSIFEYLSKNKFLIPLYQRGYIWSEEECEQLWDDITNFFFNKEYDDKYFLGSVVMYKENGLQNIIDGQQRTTTLSLFVRALYNKATNQKSDRITRLKNDLSSCLWDIDGLSGDIDFHKFHLKSEVIIDSDNEILAQILSNSYELPENLNKKTKSNYEANYLYFIRKIDEFAKEKPDDWLQFCLCLLHDCIVLPIECDGQENALRIFNTLNNRGVALSTADIFKGLIYANIQNKEEFAMEWKNLENQISNSSYLNKDNVTFLFNQLEHILRASRNEVDTVMPSTLDFFTKKDKPNSKKKAVNFGANDDLLAKYETFELILDLANFWCNPKDYMSKNAQKYFDILGLYQNKIWQMVLSMCYYTYKDELKNTKVLYIFDEILPQLVSYLSVALIYGKGGSSGIFWGLMKANINIKDKKTKIFEKSLAIPDLNMPKLDYFIDFSSKALAKQVRYILSVYALVYDENQDWEWNTNKKNYSVIRGEIEHIFPKKWQETNYNGWNEKEATQYLEQIGNKILLEKKLNIYAGNGYFGRKKEQYKNSNFKEVIQISNLDKNDWIKDDIEQRNEKIYCVLQDFFKKQLFEI